MIAYAPKVLHVVPALDTGGMERVVVDLATNRDGPTSIVCFRELGAFGLRLQESGGSIEALPKRRTATNRILQLRNYIRESRADIVHCHNLQAFTYGAAATVGMRPRLVMTKHGTRMPERVTLGERFRVSMARRSSLVGVSAEIRDLLARWTDRTRNVHVIRNGLRVSASDQTRTKGKIGEALTPPHTAIIVARLGPEKDHESLLSAIPQIANSLPEFKLLIVGDGPLRDHLEERAQQFEIANHVKFLGERHDVDECLSRAGVMVLSSVTEGTPMCLLEAMSHGLPVVATRVGGIPDLITDQVDGLLVEPKDPPGIARAIVQILTDPRLSDELACRGMQRVAREFSIEQTLSAYEELYTSEESPS